MGCLISDITTGIKSRCLVHPFLLLSARRHSRESNSGFNSEKRGPDDEEDEYVILVTMATEKKTKTVEKSVLAFARSGLALTINGNRIDTALRLALATLESVPGVQVLIKSTVSSQYIKYYPLSLD